MSVSVAIVGSHGIKAERGGWDQLVNNLGHYKTARVVYTVFNPKENLSDSDILAVKVKRLPLTKRSSLSSILADSFALVSAARHDTILLLGPKVVPLAIFLKFFTNTNLVVNVGGIEWLRPQFGRWTKLYLRLCFSLAVRYANTVILDNKSYFKYVDKKFYNRCEYIPYGAEISQKIGAGDIDNEFPFVKEKYFLSVSRSIIVITTIHLNGGFIVLK